MIPDIAVMLGGFGITVMLYIITREQGKATPKFVQFIAILATIAAVVCIADIIQQSNDIQKSIQAPQQP